MKIISSHTHGILDYVVGLLLIVAPWSLHFAEGGPETWIPVVLGASALVYSLLTRYDLGVVKVLPFRAHLTLDFLSGVLLAASPWLFQFSDRVYLPHLLVGAFEIFAALCTRTVDADVSSAHAVHHGV
jgi:SPW repeat